jgi:hypothetical protein
MPYLYRDNRTDDMKERALQNPNPELRSIGCCEKAVTQFCVCEISYTCPEHKRRVCIGTHD